ncbi:hypothetical protein B0H14DRAFT_2567331 [Mycena olivaceomarginata]|nr:hypothetical protein B0H14DRAFT_2567331 [Mycena olivaceomarginata]
MHAGYRLPCAVFSPTQGFVAVHQLACGEVSTGDTDRSCMGFKQQFAHTIPRGTQPEYREALALSAQGTPSEPGFCRLVLYPSTLGYLVGARFFCFPQCSAKSTPTPIESPRPPPRNPKHKKTNRYPSRPKSQNASMDKNEGKADTPNHPKRNWHPRQVRQRLRRQVASLEGEGRESEHAPSARLLLAKQKRFRAGAVHTAWPPATLSDSET